MGFSRQGNALWHNGSNTLWYAEVMFDQSRGIVAAAAANDGRAGDLRAPVGAALVAELRHEHRDLKEIIILSFDSDFVSVLNHIQLQDIHGVGMVDPETKFAQAFRNIVDLTIERPDFMRAMDYVPAKRSWFGLGKEKVAKTEAAKPKAAPAKPASENAVAPAPATSDGRFDFAAAAAMVVKYAEENQLVYLGQELVRRLLIGQQGFVVGAQHWATLSYKGFIEQLAEREPRLRVERKQQGKGVVLVFRTTSAT
jgi:hypothetical protein